MATRHYVYRCTTDKLAESLDNIEDAGDTVLEREHLGGRDWVLVCRTAPVRASNTVEQAALKAIAEIRHEALKVTAEVGRAVNEAAGAGHRRGA